LLPAKKILPSCKTARKKNLIHRKEGGKSREEVINKTQQNQQNQAIFRQKAQECNNCCQTSATPSKKI
jgi:hypothetical protein